LVGQRVVEEGVLRVYVKDGRPPVARLDAGMAAPSLDGGLERLPWWVRMYQRRAFTPGELMDADARRLVPGPFRHHWPRWRGEDGGAPPLAHAVVEVAAAPGASVLGAEITGATERAEAAAEDAAEVATVARAASPDAALAGRECAPEQPKVAVERLVARWRSAADIGERLISAEAASVPASSTLESAVTRAWGAFEQRERRAGGDVGAEGRATRAVRDEAGDDEDQDTS
jgi:hypothetical protein